MGTTYLGRGFGVMVFRDSISGQFLYEQYVKHETNQLYLDGIKEISGRGISVQAIICDGRKGLVHSFSDIPVQMCQFHQVQTVTKYLTRKPKSECAVELRKLALQLSRLDESSFCRGLEQWYKNGNLSSMNALSHLHQLSEKATIPIKGLGALISA